MVVGGFHDKVAVPEPPNEGPDELPLPVSVELVVTLPEPQLTVNNMIEQRRSIRGIILLNM